MSNTKKKPNPEPAALHDDNPEWTAQDLAQARPAHEVLPQLFGTRAAQQMLKPRGRPKAEFPKVRINIRLSPEVIAHFKQAGEGWQTRIDAALQQHIAKQARAQAKG